MSTVVEQKMTEAQPSRPFGPVRFVAMVVLLAMSVFATTAVAVVLIPDATDYVRAGVMKHDRLASLPSPKIVLIGGSNLAYGTDGALLEQETGCPVVNMGLNGYLGVRLMLAESAPQLHASDIAVISLEYQNFYNPSNGDPVSQLMLAKDNPEIIRYLSWWQRLASLSQLPHVAQEKVLRVMHSVVSPPSDNQEVITIKSIESLSGFDKYGGLTSHLGVEWPYAEVDRFDLSAATIVPDVLPLLRSFSEEMNARGVRVIYSYSPVKRDFFDEHAKAINALHERLAELPSLVVTSLPETFAYDNSLFFDSIYHLGAEGRERRSKQLAADIRDAVFQGGDCVAGPLGKQG
ncbi:hypothetical protein [Mesorhizobium sp. CAU 1741]|uniref:hypothetical protein n=1 Tax=Mesorhizobium sp. CAU 1741 TaxID=3140366 RepID=UPI00325BB89F